MIVSSKSLKFRTIHELKYLFITCSLPFTVVPIYFQRIIEKGRNKFLPLKSKYYLYSNFKTSSTGYLTDLSSSTFLSGFPIAIPITGTYCSESSPITLAAFFASYLIQTVEFSHFYQNVEPNDD